VSMPFTAPVAAPSTSEAASHAMHQSALDVLSSEQYAAIVEHVTAHVTGQFEDKLTAKSQQAAELERQLGVVRNAMRTSDDHVRSAIVDWTSARGIDNSEVNDLLNELDLDPLTEEYEVEVKVMAWQTVRITVDAVDRDEAERLVNEGDDGARNKIDNELSGYDWEVEEYEVSDVTLA
jgi:hypothetical protein